MTREEWIARRTFRGADFDPERLVHERRAQALEVSVVLPALEVADTIGPIVDAVRARWVDDVPLVDEVVVVDGRSSDDTVRVAREAGALVVQQHEVLPSAGRCGGKGDALWKSLAVARGDLVLWLDSDVEGFDSAFVPGMLGPLVTVPEIQYVKGLYRRALGDVEADGGRVTEICARPLINLFRPELAGLVQPLAGEAAGRRSLLERLPFFTGYAVEIGLLLDIHRRHGLAALAQVDLGERRHRHQSTAALGEMAYGIIQAVLRRLAEDGRAPGDLAEAGPYVRPVPNGGDFRLESVEVRVPERPPIAEVAEYRARHPA